MSAFIWNFINVSMVRDNLFSIMKVNLIMRIFSDISFDILQLMILLNMALSGVLNRTFVAMLLSKLALFLHLKIESASAVAAFRLQDLNGFDFYSEADKCACTHFSITIVVCKRHSGQVDFHHENDFDARELLKMDLVL